MDGELSSKRSHQDASEDTDGVPASKKARSDKSGLAKYGDNRQRLLQLVQKLNAAGARAMLDIPRVVVIGNQSAGKSSVIEAISGITVPRDAGTCTRCPMECRMVKVEESWSCRLSIRLEYDERTGSKLDKPDERFFGDIITDKALVEIALRRAQFAVLNPESSRSEILTLSLDAMKSGNYGSHPLEFSRNIVCVDIRGPECTDLDFIDLPGLIQVHEKADLVGLVERLVIEHIKGDAIILVTIPMTDDLENQKALTLARNTDPAGSRTIGVLTKADAVPPTSRARDLWLEVIEGRRRPLVHGYYCTRQPDDVEREHGIDRDTARAKEAAFFQGDPWSRSLSKNHFGIDNLVQKIAPLLEYVIKKRLPGLVIEANEKLAECERELARLPPATSKDSVQLMLDLVFKLSTDTAELVQATQGNEALFQKCRGSFKRFQETIRATAPLFIPFDREEKSKQSTTKSASAALTTAPPKRAEKLAGFAFGASSPGAGSNTPSTATGAFGQPASNGAFGQAPSTTSAFGNGAFGSGAFGTSGTTAFSGFGAARQNAAKPIEQPQPPPPKPAPAPQPPKDASVEQIDLTQDSDDEDSAAESKGMYLNEMREHIEKSLSRELPGDVPLSAKHALIVKYQGDWEKAARTCIDDVREQTRQMLDELIAARFGQWDYLHEHIRAEVYSLVNLLCIDAWKSVSNILKTERTPMTQNEHYFEDSQKIWLEKYRAQRKSSSQDADPDIMKQMLALAAQAGFGGFTAESLAARLNQNNNDVERELGVMAYVRGYFKVSYKRIIDTVPQHIDLLFLKGLAENLQPFLLEKLEIGDTADVQERFERYFAEDEEIVARRKELTQRKTTLELVKMQLSKHRVSK